MKNQHPFLLIQHNFWAALAPALGAIAGGAISAVGQGQANEANIAMNERNKEWQEYMSNTAHQREVNDLREAGLNPILSATKGASTPTPNLAKVDNVMSHLGSAVANSAADAVRINNETKQVGSTVALQEAQGAAAAAQANLSNASAKRNEVETEVLGYQKGAIKSRATLEQKQNQIDEKYIKLDNTVKRINQGLGAANSAKDLVNPFIKGGDRRTYNPKKRGTYDKRTGEIYE